LESSEVYSPRVYPKVTGAKTMSLFDKQPSRFTEKIDVLDLLINLLREHEEKLDKLVTRLEDMGLNSESIEKLIENFEAKFEASN